MVHHLLLLHIIRIDLEVKNEVIIDEDKADMNLDNENSSEEDWIEAFYSNNNNNGKKSEKSSEVA